MSWKFLFIEIPTDTPLFSMRSTLDGAEFTLRFDYSEKQDRWSLSVYDVNNEPIRLGVKLLPRRPLLPLGTHQGRPKGYLYILGPEDTPPGFADLGRTHLLYYLTDVT